MGGAAVGTCPACVEDGLCASCGEGLQVWGAVKNCVRCGFVFDEAAERVAEDDALLEEDVA